MAETRKTVNLPVVVVFEGDYYDADEVTGALQGWIEAALGDRDNLREVNFGPAEVTEVPLDG